MKKFKKVNPGKTVTVGEKKYIFDASAAGKFNTLVRAAQMAANDEELLAGIMKREIDMPVLYGAAFETDPISFGGLIKALDG